MEYSFGALTYLGRADRRLMAQFSYRPIDIDLQAYGKSVNYKNDSRGVEILYNPLIMFGLAPFIGVGRFSNKMEYTDSRGDTYYDQKDNMGWLLGWDILRKPDSHFYVRFLARYQHKLIFDHPEREIKFPNAEINYIGFVFQY